MYAKFIASISLYAYIDLMKMLKILQCFANICRYFYEGLKNNGFNAVDPHTCSV
jgi:hypothetical protein